MTYSIGFPSDGVPNRGWKLYITSLVMVLTAGLFVIARCVVRVKSRQLGVDDYTIVLSMAISIVLSVAIQTAITHGYGQRRVNLERDQLLRALMWFYVAQTPYKVVVGLNKTSVVLFYKRIFTTHRFQIVCWVVLAIIVGWTVGTCVPTIVQCVPIPASWDRSIEAHCIDQDSFWVAFAVSNVLTDVLVLAIPIPEIFKLHLTMRQRCGVLAIFLLGGFVVVCGVMRTTSVTNSLSNKSDVTYNFINRGIWTLIEANMGIICACLPLLYRPISKWTKSTLEKTLDMTGIRFARARGIEPHEMRAPVRRGESKTIEEADEVEMLRPCEIRVERAFLVHSNGHG